MNRRDFLGGNLCGVSLSLGAVLVSDMSEARKRGAAAPSVPKGAQLSYAQQGEDLALGSILHAFGIEKPTYIDIGAWDPVVSNNTYLMYQRGGTGVLVEPNPGYTPLLKKVRPRDTVLQIGIGVTDQTEADYYVTQNSQLNTFSKEEADRLIATHGPQAVTMVVKIPLVNINKVLAENFAKAPDVFSIDIEGLDYAILRTLDFKRYRPATFCVETVDPVSGLVRTEVVELMRENDYVLRGGSYVNSIFADARLPRGGWKPLSKA